MCWAQKIDQINLFSEPSTKKKLRNLKKEFKTSKRYFIYFFFLKIFIYLFFQEREVNKENRIKAEQAKNARLEALKEKALAEEAERQAKAEARKAEILAGKF